MPFPYPRELADEWIASTRAARGRHAATIWRSPAREGEQEILVGVVGLRVDTGQRSGRLGYWVGRRFWGHGVATEAAGRLARWAFANLDIDRIDAGVVTDNPASAAVLRRIGFRDAGEGTDEFLARGGEHAVSGASRRRATTSSAMPSRRRPRPAPSRCCWSPPAR